MLQELELRGLEFTAIEGLASRVQGSGSRLRALELGALGSSLRVALLTP